MSQQFHPPSAMHSQKFYSVEWMPGNLFLHPDGEFSTPNIRGDWKTTEDGDLLLRIDSGPWMVFDKSSEGFHGSDRRLIDCQATFTGVWSGFDPSLGIYRELSRLPVTVNTTWGSQGERPFRSDVTISGENVALEAREQGIRWSFGPFEGLASFFIGTPALEDPRAFHLPHFYDYWFRLRGRRAERKHRNQAISLVSSNPGAFGSLARRKLDIAIALSRWFPIMASPSLRGHFAGCSNVSFWEVPRTPLGKYQFTERSTFNLCFENSASNGYLTEKPFDALYAGSVPIYDGDPGVSNWLDPSGMVLCHHLTAEEIADRIRQAQIDGVPEMVDEKREDLVLVGKEAMLLRLENFVGSIKSTLLK